MILDSETYLIEAKWQRLPIGSHELHAFAGTMRNKSAFARGLYISDSGFSQDGIEAFGRGGGLICLSGRDLHEILSSNLLLDDMLPKKWRLLTETGNPFVEVWKIANS